MGVAYTWQNRRLTDMNGYSTTVFDLAGLIGRERRPPPSASGYCITNALYKRINDAGRPFRVVGMLGSVSSLTEFVSTFARLY